MIDDSDTTSNEQDRRPDPAATGGRPSFIRDWILLGTVVGVFALDQATKRLIDAALDLGESWPSEGFIRITYGTNSGTAFGLFPNQTPLLIVVSIVAIGFLVYFYRAHAMPSVLLRIAIGLQLGGAFGNLIDRVRAGTVTDFIDVGPWPIFNIADSSIVVGIVILISTLLFTNESTRKKPTAPQPADADSREAHSSVSSPPRDE